MAEAILVPLDAQANRNSKDSVFCNLFEQPGYLLQMYSALHPEDDITGIEDITLVTLDHKLLQAQYNDLGFIVGNRLMVLVEAQSTWTMNILIRFLIYLGETYQRYIRNNKLNVYGTKKIKIPTPELYVIYPGPRGNKPEEISLARDVFGIEPEDAFVDVRAKIIYDGRQGDIINQYIIFCRVFDEQVKKHGRTMKAVEETIRVCKDRDVLKEYLAQREVAELMFGYFDMEEQLNFMRQEERAEGEKIGQERGEKIGQERGEKIGQEKGEKKFGSLMTKLFSQGRTSDAEKAAADPAYREKLYQEFQMA